MTYLGISASGEKTGNIQINRYATVIITKYYFFFLANVIVGFLRFCLLKWVKYVHDNGILVLIRYNQETQLEQS